MGRLKMYGANCALQEVQRTTIQAAVLASFFNYQEAPWETDAEQPGDVHRQGDMLEGRCGSIATGRPASALQARVKVGNK
jgi:hypothetical protein